MFAASDAPLEAVVVTLNLEAGLQVCWVTHLCNACAGLVHIQHTAGLDMHSQQSLWPAFRATCVCHILSGSQPALLSALPAVLEGAAAAASRVILRICLQEDAVSSDLVFVVSGSSELRDALDQRGVNATETQLLFSSGSPGTACCCLSCLLITALLPGAPELRALLALMLLLLLLLLLCFAWFVAARLRQCSTCLAAEAHERRLPPPCTIAPRLPAASGCQQHPVHMAH